MRHKLEQKFPEENAPLAGLYPRVPIPLQRPILGPPIPRGPHWPDPAKSCKHFCFCSSPPVDGRC